MERFRQLFSRRRDDPAAEAMPQSVDDAGGSTLDDVRGGTMTHDVGRKVIGDEQIAEAMQILQEYKRGKASLERRIVDNEQWYRLRHWES